MDRTYTVTAIALRGHALNEADKILTLLTRERGLLRVVAKGLRKPKNRIGGRLEPLREAEVMLARGKNMDVVVQAESTRTFPDAQRDFESLAGGMSAAELMAAFLEEDEPVPELYDLFAELLGLLGPAHDAETLLSAFELQLLELLGYRPELESCLSCERELDSGEQVWGLNIQGGGVVCTRCEGLSAGRVYRLNAGAWQMLVKLQRTPLAECRRISAAPRVMSACRHALKDYLTYRAERELKAQRMFDWEAGLAAP